MSYRRATSQLSESVALIPFPMEPNQQPDPSDGHPATSTQAEAEVVVELPHQLRSRLNGARSVRVQAATVREAIQSLETQFPGITFNLCYETGELRRFVNVFVEGEDIRYLDGLETGLETGQTIHVFHSVAGGQT